MRRRPAPASRGCRGRMPSGDSRGSGRSPGHQRPLVALQVAQDLDRLEGRHLGQRLAHSVAPERTRIPSAAPRLMPAATAPAPAALAPASRPSSPRPYSACSGSWSRTSGLRFWRCDDGTYGGLATIRSKGPATASSSDVSTNVTRPADAKAPGVGARDRQRRRRDIGGRDARGGQLMRQGDGQAAAARADIRDGPRAVSVAQPRQRRLDDELGLGPGNEHGRRDEKLEVPELAMSDDVGHRLAPFAGGRPAPRRRHRPPAPAARHGATDRSRDPSPARAAPALRRRLRPDRAGFPRE